jgi:polar amino acid transport system permease protein
VISVEELTLRSTQLASSTFDFFSIFFASGVVYLALTGSITAVQLLAETWLDLDRPSLRERLARLLPWRRPVAMAKPGLAPALPKPEAPRPDDVPRIAVMSPGPAPDSRDLAARAATLARRAPGVEVSGLRKRYAGHVVLDGLDLTVRQGEVVALLGRSGSGKSTLLRCINRLEGWEDGEVRVGGRQLGFHEDGNSRSPRALARERASVGVGMVFQQFNLFSHLTARENVAGPLRWVHGVSHDEATRRATALLERVGMADRAGALPRHLSGGQQQRVAIARALAPNPTVLLLDEPTSALDPELVHEVLEVIRSLAFDGGLTMIIATHQLRFAREVADRIVFLSDGRVTEEGLARDVLTRPRHPLTARFLRIMGADEVLEVPA